MPDKIRPIGICDQCGGPIDPRFWYTSKGRPRLHCSINCRNAANSQKGAPIRAIEQREHVARGEWQNPAKLHPPTGAEQAERARKGRLRELVEGRWRNPGQTPEARAINTLPRKHTGDLASALKKLKTGIGVVDLAPAEQEAHRAYRRRQQASRWAAMTGEEKEKRRQQWRRNKKQK